ncbi:hypothetical protein [Caenibius sp. WL]|uniref:hypothetical protein n=1 Tax=Caenibius sp. WL TaxID=2872646 RepID=UPI001C98F952|nr:hypothetical protein [Caenibius sp. WL]QZP06818.1 hypothetical protein K5X80_08760 [Caenibius sp. WL]
MSFLGKLVAAAAASVGMGIRTPHHMGRTRYAPGWKHVGDGRYMPHQGKREIARRLRQAEAIERKRAERIEAVRHIYGGLGPTILYVATGITRRGRFVISGFHSEA